ncbi:MAG TPA: gliding motility lipoprotein GldH [Chitinophagaceae bacterium]|nr:gliding motility lipoprotein GldH [Chitinophagaceae bacterium]
MSMFSLPIRKGFLRTLPALLCLAWVSSCTTLDLYEKDVRVPGHRWESSFKPEFNFTIRDTTARYQLFFVFRHSDRYNYNNIWINLYSTPPGDTVHRVRYELNLATNDKGWLATGMDDMYEHRIPLTDPQPWKAGTYTFMIEQIMREDPLANVFGVGLRLEKKP